MRLNRFPLVRGFVAMLICVTPVSLALLVGACATKLKEESNIRAAPSEFDQRVETVAIPVVRSEPSISSAPLATPPIVGPKVEDPPKQKADTGKSQAKAVAKQLPPKGAGIKAPTPQPGWQPKAWPYGIGERIVYGVRYGVIEGGIATLVVEEPKLVNGVPVIHYSGHVRSSKMLEFFYKLDDSVNSFMTLESHLPIRQEIVQNQSAVWGRRVVLFDHDKKNARFYSHTEKKDGAIEEIKREDAMTFASQDVFGSLYYFRFLDELNGASFPIHDRWRNWNNTLEYVGPEVIEVPAGRFETQKYKMLPRVTGQLENKGDLEVWIADDPTKIIVRFRAKLRVGSITGDLREYVPGQTPDRPPPRLLTPFRVNKE